MVMLLVSSLASLAVICVIEYISGRRALLPAVSERMVELREGQKRALEMLFADLTNSLIVYSRGSAAIEAVQAFTAGFDQLADAYLQLHYTVPSFGASAPPDDAGDGSAWSAANARFDNYFREIATRFEYRDAMLLDTRGDLVYSVKKGPALGTNILAGPDKLMRSDSRLFLEDPKKYQRGAEAAGIPPDIVDQAIRWHGTTLVQPVETAAGRASERGQSGTMIDTGYLGERELVAYAGAGQHLLDERPAAHRCRQRRNSDAQRGFSRAVANPVACEPSESLAAGRSFEGGIGPCQPVRCKLDTLGR